MNTYELITIVNNRYSNYYIRREFWSKIDNGVITTKEELEKEIQNEERKAEYRRIVNESNLDIDSVNTLYSKITNEEITTKEELEKEIQTEERKSEYRRIVNESKIDDTLKIKLKSKIRNNQIINKEELKKVINEREKKIESARRLEERLGRSQEQSKSYSLNLNKPWKYK